MLANNRRKILQVIVGDPASAPAERTAAQRALCELKPFLCKKGTKKADQVSMAICYRQCDANNNSGNLPL